jgi:MFS family permease
MSYISLLRTDARTLAYSFAFTFGSSVGQTFFVSLFMPAVATAVATSHAQLATLYSAATVLSAVALPWLGRLIDRMDILKYGMFTAGGALTACLLMACASNWWMVLAAMCLLRLFGLGLMSHVGWTAAGRYFELNRGKALSLVGLGHSVGEGLFPVLIVSAIALFGWRFAYAGAGIAVALLLIPLASLLIVDNRRFRHTASEPAETTARKDRRRSPVLRSVAFWCYVPLLATSPLVLTALLFFHGLIAQTKGLSLEVFAVGFIGFAVVQIPASMIVGHLIDKYGSRLPLMFHIAPLTIGTAVLALGNDASVTWVFLTLAGITTAANAILRTAVMADLFEPDQLGEARSFLAGLLVLAAAAGPVLYGWPLSTGVEMNSVLWATVPATILAAIPAVTYTVVRTSSLHLHQ